MTTLTYEDIRGEYLHLLAQSYEETGKKLWHRMIIDSHGNKSAYFVVSRNTNKDCVSPIVNTFIGDNLTEALAAYNSI